MKLSIVIPCYNEEKVIRETNKRLLSLVSNLFTSQKITDFEIIYVDDGSYDKTLDILKNFSQLDKRIKIISFSRNFGHQAALTAGLWYSSGDIVVTLDADLQDPPEIIEKMIEKYKEGYEIVYGVRKNRKRDSFFKRNTAQIFYKLMQLMGVNIIYNHADFRLLSKNVVKEFRKLRETNRFIRGLIPYLGFKSSYVYYDRKERFAGKTKYPFKRMVSFAWEGITSFTYIPLKLSLFAGIFICLVSLFYFWAVSF